MLDMSFVERPFFQLTSMNKEEDRSTTPLAPEPPT